MRERDVRSDEQRQSCDSGSGSGLGSDHPGSFVTCGQVGITLVVAAAATVAEEVSKVGEGEDGDGDWGPVMLANWDDARRQNVSFFSIFGPFFYLLHLPQSSHQLSFQALQQGSMVHV